MSMISVPKSDLEMIFNLIGAKLSDTSGSSTVKLNKSGKVKKQNSNKGKPTCHGEFVKMVCAKFKDQVAKYKEENPEQKGAHLIFASKYKKDHADEYAIFEADFKIKEAEKADNASVVSSDSTTPSNVEEVKPEKAKRPPMSDAQKVKMKIGRELAAAKKKAEKEAVSA